MTAKTYCIAISCIPALVLGTNCQGSSTPGKVKADALQEQLEFARSEGIPTTYAEYAKLFKPCKPEENAAPYYVKLEHPQSEVYHQLRGSTSIYDLAGDLLFDPSVSNVKLARKLLVDNRSSIALIEQAVTKPRCWFNRDWTLPYWKLDLGLFSMKDEARLLLIRAELEAIDGKHSLALEDIVRIHKIAFHAAEEPRLISHLISDDVESIAFRGLAALSFRFRENEAYRTALKSGTDQMIPPDDKAEHSGELLYLLRLMDDVKTKKGQLDLGIEPDVAEIPEAGKETMARLSQGKGKADVVRACRLMWKAYSLPMGENRKDLLHRASSLVMAGLMSQPLAWKMASPVDPLGDIWTDERDESWQAGREIYTAAYRALSANQIPTQIKTDDLLSPFDGKPLSYRFDGKQITIEVDSDDAEKPFLLKIPPGSAGSA